MVETNCKFLDVKLFSFWSYEDFSFLPPPKTTNPPPCLTIPPMLEIRICMTKKLFEPALIHHFPGGNACYCYKTSLDRCCAVF